MNEWIKVENSHPKAFFLFFFFFMFTLPCFAFAFVDGSAGENIDYTC
jgi:hypothetical protein